MKSIFSTYSTGENRVTASFLAVLQSLSLDRIQELLGKLLEQAEFELMRFDNQHAGDGDSVPDAIIQSSLRLLIETKIKRNAVDLVQITGHLEQLDKSPEADKKLLLITPDEVRPAVLNPPSYKRVAWTSFNLLDQAIDEIISDEKQVMSEREQFLLRELQKMLVAEGLVPNTNDVVVVAARNAWPEYQEIHAYVCQPERSFQHVNRIGFYSLGQVYPLVPKILEKHDNVVIAKGKYEGNLGRLVNRLLDEGRRKEGIQFKVLLLSAPDSSDTLKLPGPIPNNVMSKSGKPTAFTMGQRYVTAKALMTAKTTSDLV